MSENLLNKSELNKTNRELLLDGILMIYDKKSKFACEQSDIIIAISEHTKEDIINYYGIDEHKIKVVYQSVNPIYYEENKMV